MRQPSFTCPIIDKAIAAIDTLENAALESDSSMSTVAKYARALLEDIRAANTKLRDYGHHYEDKTVALEQDVSRLEDALVEKHDELVSLRLQEGV